MNIIQKQAIEFIQFKMGEHRNYKDFIEDVRSELWEYKRDTYKIEFVERVIKEAKIKYDAHILVCTNKNSCPTNKFYENTLFFLQEELEELEHKLTPESFNQIEKGAINETLQIILDDLNKLKLGQEITYTDLSNEFEELKDLYFLDKKNWLQLFQGKVSEMVAGGVISETVSKSIVTILSENYEKLIGG